MGADLSYVWTREGWLYLAVVIDLFARVVGWEVSDRLHKQLALEALGKALTMRRSQAGLIHHSDRGFRMLVATSSIRVLRQPLESALHVFAGVVSGHADAAIDMRTTCIVDIPRMTPESAERIATFMNSAAMTGDGKTSPLHVNTAFDPLAKCLKVVVIGSPSDAARLLDMLQLVSRS